MKKILTIISVFSLQLSAFSIAAAGTLSQDFGNPPQDARPLTWWHWMNGHVTKRGITADLEAMKDIGLGGAQIFNVAGMPAGPIKFMSAEWREMVKHAAEECARLGLELDIHNCPGWSSSGGPWNKPENSMLEVVAARTLVKGPGKFNGTLPRAPEKHGFYGDIAVLAFPTPEGAGVRMTDFLKKITASQSANAKSAADNKAETFATIPFTKKTFLLLEFEKPYLARQVAVTPGPKMRDFKIIVEASDDGVNFRFVGSYMVPAGKYTRRQIYPFAPAEARAWRVSFELNGAPPREITVAEIELTPQICIANFTGKTFLRRGGDCSPSRNLSGKPSEMLNPETIVDLTRLMSPDGKLNWDVPAGNWTILRLGCAPNGVSHTTRPAGGEGLECDKLNPAAVDAHWDGMMAKIISDIGPLAGTTFRNVVLDSYEVGSQNWTPKMREEFQARTGYDLFKMLPVFDGYIVGSIETTERFLWDFRRTVADMFAEYYAGRLAELAHKNGMILSIEPYGNSPSDDIQYGTVADVPMGEFWVQKGVDGCMKLAASAAHINGAKIVATESFTAGEKGGNKWEYDPAALRPIGDAIYSTGVNRFIFHTYTHQPYPERAPGFTMGATGTHFEHTTTWWKQSAAWMKYLSRSQALLQQGRQVADVAYFLGEGVPTSMYGDQLVRGVPGLPLGYDYDGIDAASLRKTTVKNGCITLPSGASYRVLVLANTEAMTLPLIQKLKQIADAGIPIVGPKPVRTPGLANYPESEKPLRQIADALEKNGAFRPYDKLPQLLQKISLQPDFEVLDIDADAMKVRPIAPGIAIVRDGGPGSPNVKLTYVHRTVPEGELYFIANPRPVEVEALCSFRVADKLPQFWNADTGQVAAAPVFTVENNRTVIPLRLPPAASVFVLFKNTTPGDHAVAAKWTGEKLADQLTLDNGNYQLRAASAGTMEVKTASGKTLRATVDKLPQPLAIEGPWRVTFPEKLGAPKEITLEKLISWTDHSEFGVKYFSGTATYHKTIKIPSDRLRKNTRLILDLGAVKNIARVKLNGRDLGLIWKLPFRTDIADFAKAGDNTLEIAITNLWVNRLIGDEQLPPDVEWMGTGIRQFPQWFLDGKPSPTGRIAFSTRRLLHKTDPILESGLLGPVRLRTEAVTQLQ